LPEYQSSWERRRPESKFFNCMVTDHADTVEPFYRSELPGISSISKPEKGPAGRVRAFEEIQVPTITLTRLLEENQVSKIDLLSIDIEGAEPLALAGRCRPLPARARDDRGQRKPGDDREVLHRSWLRAIERYLEYGPVNYYFAPKTTGISRSVSVPPDWAPRCEVRPADVSELESQSAAGHNHGAA
jgi:hypothetical protein